MIVLKKEGKIADTYSGEFCGVLINARLDNDTYAATCFFYSITAGLSSGVTIFSISVPNLTLQV